MRYRQNLLGTAAGEHTLLVTAVGLVGALGFGALGPAFRGAISDGGSGAATLPAGDAAGQAYGPTSQAASEHGYTVQVVAYEADDRARAQAFADRLRGEHGFDAFVEQDPGGYWVVRINNVQSYAEADDLRDVYAQLGLTNDAFIANHSGLLTPNQEAFLAGAAAGPGADPTTEPAPESAAPETNVDTTAETPAAETGTSDMGFPTRVAEDPSVVTAGAATDSAAAREGGIWGFVKGLGSGLWDGAKSVVGGTVRMVKSIGWDFLVEDVVLGTVKGLAGAGCRLISFGNLCEGSSLNPISSITESLGNLWNKKGAIVEYGKMFLGNVGTCFLGNGANGGDRGYACGRGTADVVALIWGPKVAKGVKNFVVGKSATIAERAPVVLAEGAGTTTANASRAARVLDAARRTTDDAARVARDLADSTFAVINNVEKLGQKILSSKRPSVVTARSEAANAGAAGKLADASADAQRVARADAIVNESLPNLAEQVRQATRAGDIARIRELKSSVRGLNRELERIRTDLGIKN